VHGPALHGHPAPPRPRDRRTLTRADWIGAALDALARDGLRAVAVEPLAERLGATKGSFYWHFRDRNALLEAAVAQWERTATDEVLAALEPIPDPRERQRATAAALAGSERDIQIFLVLLWNADHPVIGPAVDRVLGKRTAFSQRCLEEAGHTPEQAHASMLYSYSLFLGVLMLRRAAPGMIPESCTPDGLQNYVATLIKQAAGGFLAPTAA
jgi:AcrR family transcriptional regulator